MTEKEAYTEIRDLLGGVSDQQVTDRSLRSHLARALEWLRKELGTDVSSDMLMFAAESGRQEYPLPSEVDQVKWVMYNGVPLSPATTEQWLNDRYYWNQQVAGYPAEYAIEGRKIIFSQPFSADAVGTTTEITVCFRGASREIRPASMPNIPDSHAALACTYAARRYCIANRQNEQLAARVEGLTMLIAEDLPTAKFEASQPIQNQQPEFRVETGRMAAAR